MTKPNPTAAAPAATDLRQRAARARDAAGRFIKRTPPVEPPAQAETPAPVALPSEQILSDAIDLTDAPLQTLLAVHDVADVLSELAAAVSCQPRCYVDASRHGVENAAGRLVSWITEACSHVANAAVMEARRREPGSRPEAVARLSIIVRADIGGGTRSQLSHLVGDVAALSIGQAEH